MNAQSHRYSLEESILLLDEKTPSDIESDVDKAEIERLSSPRPFLRSLIEKARNVEVSSWRSILVQAGIALVPSFIQSRVGLSTPKPDRLCPTSYLDGMRGLAALFVFFCHYTYTSFIITYGYGYGKEGENHYFLQLPIIRLIYSGPPMVCIFFVVSGYALSLKPIKQMRSESWESLFTTLNSSVFRRGMRLFVPTAISTFMVFIMLRLGFYESTREFARNRQFIRNVVEFHPHQMPTFFAQLRNWIWEMFNFVHFWGWEPFGGSTGYDVHLWTIPVEFRCSMILFLSILGLSRLRTKLRLIFLAGIALATFRADRWEMALFFCGMFLAEIDTIRGSKSANRLPTSHGWSSPLTPQYARAFWIVLSVLALYLMSQPDQFFDKTPGWIWLSSLIPEWFTEKYRYWQCIGSVLFVASVNQSPLLQWPFNNSFVQYFGKISYAIYLMHGPVLHTIGYTIEELAWGITGTETFTQFVWGFILSSLFIIPIVVWASDLFWRTVDMPSVKFARWVEQKCCKQKDRA